MSSQGKVYGQNGNTLAGLAGETILCIFSGTHNQEVNLETPLLVCAPGNNSHWTENEPLLYSVTSSIINLFLRQRKAFC